MSPQPLWLSRSQGRGAPAGCARCTAYSATARPKALPPCLRETACLSDGRLDPLPGKPFPFPPFSCLGVSATAFLGGGGPSVFNGESPAGELRCPSFASWEETFRSFTGHCQQISNHCRHLLQVHLYSVKTTGRLYRGDVNHWQLVPLGMIEPVSLNVVLVELHQVLSNASMKVLSQYHRRLAIGLPSCRSCLAERFQS